MKTIDHGLLWTELRATCTKCNCDFVFMPKDLRKHIEYSFETCTGVAYKYAICPECGSKYIYTSPASHRYFYDYLAGSPDQPEPMEYTYDGGDEDLTIIADGENEEL